MVIGISKKLNKRHHAAICQLVWICCRQKAENYFMTGTWSLSKRVLGCSTISPTFILIDLFDSLGALSLGSYYDIMWSACNAFGAICPKRKGVIFIIMIRLTLDGGPNRKAHTFVRLYMLYICCVYILCKPICFIVFILHVLQRQKTTYIFVIL